MPELSPQVIRRYGCTLLSVALVEVLRLIFYPVLGDHYLFFLHFVAIVLVAGYGGFGPSLLALGLSWLSVQFLAPAPGARPNSLAPASETAFAFICIGLPIAMLGGALRAARERATSSSAE